MPDAVSEKPSTYRFGVRSIDGLHANKLRTQPRMSMNLLRDHERNFVGINSYRRLVRFFP